MRSVRDWQTVRRLRALELSKKGWPQNRIAEALGVTKGAVSQWLKRAREVPEGQQSEALRVKKSTGRPPVLGPEERRQLVGLIERGAEAFGFIGAVWTANRVRAVARREMGVSASLATIKRFLHREGFSVQKPEVAAAQKNDKAVAGFRGGGWASLKKGQSPPERP